MELEYGVSTLDEIYAYSTNHGNGVRQNEGFPETKALVNDTSKDAREGVRNRIRIGVLEYVPAQIFELEHDEVSREHSGGPNYDHFKNVPVVLGI